MHRPRLARFAALDRPGSRPLARPVPARPVPARPAPARPGSGWLGSGWLVSILLASGGFLAVPVAGQPIFVDGFESADTTAWSQAVGAVPVTAFRMTDLDLRDPHVFLDVPLFGCSDFTDQALPLGLGPAFNSALQDAIETDDDGDGFLDLGTMVLFRPYRATGGGDRVDLRRGRCTAPAANTTCVPEPGSPITSAPWDDLDAGLCLGAVPGTTSDYSPAVDETVGPCFVAAPSDTLFDLSGLPISLVDGQTAAGWIGEPPTGLTQGLLRGFLSQADADAIPLPADLPLVGGQPLSVLFAGGEGNCAPGDDRDLHEGQVGWWLYFEYAAEAVPYAE